MKKVAFITSRMLFRNSIFIIIFSLVIFCGLHLTSPTNSYARNDTNKTKGKTKSAGTLHVEGLRLYNQGKYEEAIEIWLEELEITPKNANTHNNIGIAYYSLEDYESAVSYHKKAIEINKNFGHGYYSLGRAYIGLGKNEEGIQALSKSIELNYKPYGSYYLLGTAHKSLKEYEEARDALLKSLEFKKDPYTYHLLGDVYFDMKDYKLAKDAYIKALEANNKYFHLTKLYNSIGLVNEKLGDIKGAERAYRQAKEIERKKQMPKKLNKKRLTLNKLFAFNKLILIYGLIMSLLIGLASIPPLRMFFRAGMKGLLFKGVGGILVGFGFLGIVLNEFGGYFDFWKGPIILLSLLIILGIFMVAIGFVILNTSERVIYVELGKKSTFWQRLTGTIPILKYEKPLQRTGLIYGTSATDINKMKPSKTYIFIKFIFVTLMLFIASIFFIFYGLVYMPRIPVYLSNLLNFGTINNVEKIAPALNDKDPAVRMKAVETLSYIRIREPKAEEYLIISLKDESPLVREASAKGLFGTRNPEAVMPLILALNDENPEVRGMAARSLSRIDDKRTIEPLIEALSEESQTARKWIIQALVQKGITNIQVVELLKNSLKSETPAIRQGVEEVLAKLNKMKPKSDPREVERMIRALDEKNPINRRKEAAEALGDMMDSRAVEALIKASKDTNTEIVYRAVFSLGKIKDPKGLDTIIIALKHNDPRVRKSAIFALIFMNDPRAVEPLINTMQDEHWYIRMEAVNAFKVIRDPRAVEPVIQALKDPDCQVAEVAAQTLGELQDQRAIDPLIALLKDKNPNLRENAARSLSLITGNNFGTNYEKWKRWREKTK